MERAKQSRPSTLRPERLRLGSALRRAWVGYQRLLEGEMARAGVERRGFPDGRVLHLCARSSEVTISRIGRELGITRQGASKVVGALRQQGFVTLHPSPDDGREKLVRLTTSASAYLGAQQEAAGVIERRLKAEIGPDALEALYGLLDALGTDDQPRLRDYLHHRLM
jgi:DNA-binding MarR family transcriptional regulator